MLCPIAPNNWQYPSSPFASLCLLWIFSVIGFMDAPLSFWIVSSSHFKMTEIKSPVSLAGISSEVGSWSDCFENHPDFLVHLFVLFFQDTHLATLPLGVGGVFPQDTLSSQMDQKKEKKKVGPASSFLPSICSLFPPHWVVSSEVLCIDLLLARGNNKFSFILPPSPSLLLK